MQNIKYILILSVLLLSACCINDDNSDCPNTYLNFSYVSEENGEVGDYIHSAKLLIYNSNNELVLQRDIDQTQINQGLGIQLPPGDYYAVAWGNAGEHSVLSDIQHIEDARLSTNGYPNIKTIETNDPLYLGTHSWTISERNNYNHAIYETIDYRSAHLSVDVRIFGVEGGLAQVRVNNLMPQYNFQMGDTKPNNITYSPLVKYMEEEDMQRAYLHVLRYKGKTPMTIDILLNQESTYNVDVRKLVEQKYPDFTLERKTDFTIIIEVVFDGVEMHVQVLDWEEDNITNTPIS